MARIVIKFGGTSVGNVQKIKNAAKIIKKYHEQGNEIIVVVSAMSGVTNELIKKSESISTNFMKTEYDVLLATGEQASCSLLSGAILDLGLNSRSWLSWQIPILTDNNYSSAKILNIPIDKKFFSIPSNSPVIPAEIDLFTRL